jgi:hypothetical protein
MQSCSSSGPDPIAAAFADPAFDGSTTAATRADDTLGEGACASSAPSLIAHPSHLRLQLELTEATATAFAAQMHHVYVDAVTRHTLWQRELLLQSVADGIEATWGAAMSLADIAALGADAVDVDASVGRAVISALHGATPRPLPSPAPPPPFNGDVASEMPPLDLQLQPSSSIATAAPSPSQRRVRDEQDIMSQIPATVATNHDDNYDDDDAGMEAAVGLLEREVETLREVLSARLTSNVWTTTTGSGSAAPSKRGGGGGGGGAVDHPLRAATAAAAAQLALAGTSIGDLAAIAEGGGNSFAAAMGKVGSGEFGADSSGAPIVCIDFAESP